MPWKQQKLIIPKLTILFMTIPRSSPKTIKSLKKLFYLLIWDYKPDKISTAKLIQSYPRGGLKITDKDVFITSLQISWIKRLRSDETPVWKILGTHIKNPLRLKYFGSSWPKNLAHNIANIVWREALQSWACLLNVNALDKNRQVSSPIWYNPRILKIELFLSQLFNKGFIFMYLI